IMENLHSFHQRLEAKIHVTLNDPEDSEFKGDDEEIQNIIKINRFISQIVTIFNYGSHFVRTRMTFLDAAKQAVNFFSINPISERAKELEIKVAEYLQFLEATVM